MNNIVKNYEALSLDEKYILCSDKLLETDKNISAMDDLILNEWYIIESLGLFKSQHEYYDYMLSTEKYFNLMILKKNLEEEIEKLNIQYEFIPKLESISLHMEQQEH